MCLANLGSSAGLFEEYRKAPRPLPKEGCRTSSDFSMTDVSLNARFYFLKSYRSRPKTASPARRRGLTADTKSSSLREHR